MKTKNFKTVSIVGFLLLSNFLIAGKPLVEKILQTEKLPGGLALYEDGIQQYRLTTYYFNKDIFGNFFSKERYQGTYSRTLPDGKVMWEKVSSAKALGEHDAFGEASPLKFMEGFSYIPSGNMLNVSSLPGFPPAEVNAKNLIWDMMAFEGFAWAYFDSLKLNEYFRAPLFNGKIPMEGVGTFENRNILLKWCGITFQNNEYCAVIEFLAMDNPLDLSMDTEYFKMIAKGRSHYWGTVLVSLSDKQIEGATLHEDVLLDMVLPDGTKQLANSTRLIELEKLNVSK